MREKPLFSSKTHRENLLEWSRTRTQAVQEQERSKSATLFPWSSFNAEINSGAYSFESWFKIVLPEEGTSLQEYIEKTLPEKTFRRGLEVGGIGSRFFGGFTPGFFSATAGISLTNFYTNSAYQYPRGVERDTAHNHIIIEGNIFDDNAKAKVMNWQQGEKVDFIIERMYAGRDLLPDEPFYLGKEASFWYNMLAEGGLFFAELPRAFNFYIKEWEKYINQEYAGRLDVKVEKLKLHGEESRYLMRLHKLEGAPEELPLLDPKSVMRREREMYPHIFSTIRS